MSPDPTITIVDSKYKVESVLGGGSFSEVYVVTDPKGAMGRSALKLLRKGLGREASAEVVQDFKHEFAILKDLNHPHIARILDFGYDPRLRQYYYTTELVDGRGLFEATEGRSCEDILEWFVQALRAFNYLHSYRIHHFDVKAANVLLTKQGLIKVIDFGLAAINSGDPGGRMVGTPSYMAPEIIAPKTFPKTFNEKPDGRADLYSLGVLFYSCFTRRNPFRGKGVPETLKNQQTLVAPPASTLREDLPPFLDSILAKLLEKNPANRYQRAEEALREINFYSPKKFALETRETLLSYLPEEGRLIGRRRETEAFKRLFQGVFDPASAETHAFLLVAGDHGSGKTRLLKEFKYDAQLQGVNVVSSSARSPEERTAWLDAFRRHATEGRPTVFLLDDLDAWPDEGFLQFQAALARLLFQDATESLPLLWVGSLADPAALPPSFSELWAGRKIETLRLGSFAPEELREYVISLTGLEDPPPALLTGLEARTDGNPLLVTEFLRSLIEEGALFDQAGRWKKTTFEDLGIDFSKARFSGVLEELLYARFGKLPSGLRGVLEALSIGGALRASELSRLDVDSQSVTSPQNAEKLPRWGVRGGESGFSPRLEPKHPALPVRGGLETGLTHGIEELLARDLLIKDATGRYQVKNTTLAELIEQRLDPARRRDLHDRAAQLFREGSELRIFHEIRGSDLSHAFDLCRRTADHYLQEARGREAAALLDFARTLEIERTPEQEIELRLKLGEAGLIALDYPRALGALEEAESILSRQKMQMANVHLQVDALLRIGGVYFKMHEIEKSRGSLAAASTLLHYLKGDRVRELVAENLRGAILLEEGKLEEARRLFEGTRERWVSELDFEERSKVTNNDLGLAYLLERRYPEALKQLCADMEFLQGVGDRFVLARTHYHLGQAYAETGEFSAAVEHYELAANLAQALKHTELLLRAYNGLGNAFNVMGRPEDAIRFYDRGLDLCERTGDLRSHAAILVNIGIIRSAQSDFDRALRSLDPAVAFLKSLKNRMAIDRQVLVRALLEIGDVALKRKQWKPSEDSLREALTLAEEGEGVPSLKFWIYYTLGELFLAKGELEELRKILPDIKKFAQSTDEKERAEEISMKEKSISPSDYNERRALPARVKDPYQYILEINKFINAESDLDFVLKSVLNYALELSQAECGAILLMDAGGDLEISVSRNLEGSDPLAQIDKISRSVARKAIQRGDFVLSQNAVDDPSLGSEASVMRLDLKSVLCFPIKSKNRAIGALYLDNRLVSGAFEHVDLEALKAFADQAGIAIQNARLLAGQEASRRSLEVKVSEISTRLEHYQTLVNLSERSLDTKYDYKNIVARSKPMVEVFRLLDKITDTDLSVFIHGESGTGKELIARALHVNGRRSKKRFVAVNCGAIPANLMESELFGYKAGAFTGASRDKKGLFEEADGGMIFLDEVAEMELGLQAKLLRVVQEGEFYRVGDSQPVRCDVRVVSASNKDIQKLAKDNKFREDLYYRLCQIRIDLPPLRERREDIPRLVDHFIREEAGKPMKVSSRLLKAFLEYDWPGNIRELENLVKVAVALSDGDVIDANAVPANYGIFYALTGKAGSSLKSGGDPALPPTPRIDTTLFIDKTNHFDPSKSWYDYEKVIIAKAYEVNAFNAKETARMLGIAPATLYKKIRENGLTERDHALYSDPFRYQKGRTLKEYLKPVFEAALAHAGHKPYTAIAQLKVSQGYFYNVMKGKT